MVDIHSSIPQQQCSLYLCFRIFLIQAAAGLRRARSTSHGLLVSWSELDKSGIDLLLLLFTTTTTRYYSSVSISSFITFFQPPLSAGWWLALSPVNWQIDIDLQYTGGVSIMMDGWVISMIARPKCLSIKLIKPVNRWLVMDQEQENATSLGWLMITAHGRLVLY